MIPILEKKKFIYGFENKNFENLKPDIKKNNVGKKRSSASVFDYHFDVNNYSGHFNSI